VDGFYAAGECACVSVHGANRLGANSVLEALLFGRHVGKSIVKDIPKIHFHSLHTKDGAHAAKEIKELLHNSGQEKVSVIRDELQKSMTKNAGVFRTKDSLEAELVIIDSLRVRFKGVSIRDKSHIFNTELQEAIELGHMLDYAKFIVVGALARNESRGAHFRDDYPSRDDDNFLKHTFAFMDSNGDVKVEFAPVVLGKFKPEPRVY
jgi:succinate dehydrogenase / fumarate reductase flavoprotein subunit